MKLKLYQVFDNVAETLIGPIWQSQRHEAAARDFHEWLSDERNKIGRKADYDLYFLADIDGDTGELTQQNGRAEVIALGKE